MISVLTTGQGWLMDEIKLNRLLELSVGQNQRGQVEQCLGRNMESLSVVLSRLSELRVTEQNRGATTVQSIVYQLTQ